ncbi:hypothetical protein ACFVW1_10440 [Streptomyces olivochromogenes]|uniref:poly(ethylene terephthalate) hydrolase family protein n=1 Tax=Streptomyces olivochromogenes TaxID=1963 RepID=UPI0036DE5E01
MVVLISGMLAIPGPSASAAQRSGSVPETSRPGPYAVRSQTYDLGDTAFQPTGFAGEVELTGVVHAPRDARGRRLPLVVLLHGRHQVCGAPDGSTDANWPCRSPFTPIPSYRGYDAVGRLLASHGYVVISISANGISAADNADATYGETARGELIQKHLDLWKEWTGKGDGPFGREFDGAIDFGRIGLMGHSRGGEGIVSALKINEAAGHPYGIRAVLGIAPTDFLRQTTSGVAAGLILSECDGDQFDLEGAHYYDDALSAGRSDTSPKYQVVIAGANHYFYNSAWSPSSGLPGAMDDWDKITAAGGTGGACAPGSGERLTEAQQQAVGSAYITSFFRLRLGGERQFAGLWEGSRSLPPSASFARVATTYLAPAASGARRDVNPLSGPGDLTENALGGGVALTGFETPEFCGGAGQATECLGGNYAGKKLEPHGSTAFRGTASPGLGLLRLRWDHAGASLVNELPASARRVGTYRDLTFRAALDFSDAHNADVTDVPVRVVLTDGAGRQASLSTADHGGRLTPPAALTDVGDGAGHQLTVRRLLLSQIRVPLRAFGGIDLDDVRSVGLVFDGTPRGSVDLSGLSFSD